MPKLTIVFNYPDKSTMEEAKRMFDEQGKSGAIPNLVGTAPYDAIDKCGGYDGNSSLVDALDYVHDEILDDVETLEDARQAIVNKTVEIKKELDSGLSKH